MTTWQPGQPIRFETERFYIRSLQTRDVNETYLSWWNDPEIQAGFGFPARNWTMQDAIAHVQQFDNRVKFHLGIFVKETNEMIGFYTLFYEPEMRIAVPNICIGDKSQWKQHAATEVGGAFFNFGFNVLGANKAEGRIKGDNPASIAMLEFFGFKKEAQLRQRVKGVNGEFVDLHIYGLLKEEWQASKGNN